MSIHSRLLAAAALALAPALMLAACGAPAEEADDPVVVAGEADGAEVAALPVSGADPAAVDPGADPEMVDEETEAPAATTTIPAATPSTAAAPATVAVAAATPPPMWAVCGACHAVEAGANGIGPSLAGVFGSPAASKAGFNYSDAMAGSGLTWNEATLDRYLENPRGVVPGTIMAYAGLKNEAQRQAVIEYLKGL